MAEVRIVLRDEDYEGQVALDVDFNPELPEGTRNEDLTPAQFAALFLLRFAHEELFGPNEDGETLGDALDKLE